MKLKIITNTAIVAILFAFSISSCKKESSPENVASKTKETFDKNQVIKNVSGLAAFIDKKKAAKSDNVKINNYAPIDEQYGLQYMSGNYGDPGVNAYYVPSPIFQPNYNPVFVTTSEDLNNSTPQELSQKVNVDLNSYFNISGIVNNLNTSPEVASSLNNLSNTLEGIASDEMNSYIYNTVDTTNFDEDAYYNSLKSKTNQAINSYMYNVGNSISLTPNEQTNLLVSASYASQLINTFDLRNAVINQGLPNLSSQSIKVSGALHVNGFFSIIKNTLRRVAKVVAAVVVAVVVVVATTAVGLIAGLALIAIDPNGVANNDFAGLSAIGGFAYGLDKIIQSNLYNWAVKE